jgi:hypothetical protein
MSYISVERRGHLSDDGFPGAPGSVYGLAHYGQAAYGQAPLFAAGRSWVIVDAR